MDFFDKLGKKASETYKGAAEKTSKIAKETKLKMAINENKSKINDLYEEIGKKIYENHVREEKENLDEFLKEECTKIDVLADEIEDYRKDILELSKCPGVGKKTAERIILELKDKKQCPSCNKEIEANVKFCPNCGAEQPKVEEPKKEEIKEEDIEIKD